MAKPNIEIRQAVANDVDAIAEFNIALCRETERRELDPVTVSEGYGALFPNLREAGISWPYSMAKSWAKRHTLSSGAIGETVRFGGSKVSLCNPGF